jgi:CheY-like chemotaxis protein
MEAILTGRGAQVRCARSADEALAVLEHDLVDVVVADIGLPHADGFTLLRRMRALPRLAQLAAVAVTGFASEEDRLKITAAGYSAHVAKPFDAEALARVIARAAQSGM